MTAQILDGKKVSALIHQEIADKIKALSENSPKPKLAIIQISGDEASTIYVRHKRALAEKLGILTAHLLLPNDATFEAVQQIILDLNQNKDVHGILLQLPLPSHLSSEALLKLIAPFKDVDGLTPYNQGLLMQNQPGLRPCTPSGIMTLLQYYEIDLAGLHAVIINASKLVGKPLTMELLAAKATVTVCNSRTRNLQEHIGRADLVVCATGHPHFIDSSWLKKGCIVIDVGVHRHPSLGLIGDFEFESAKARAAWITPVPGGIGPMTVATLMQNLWSAYAYAMRLDKCPLQHSHY